MAATKLFDAVPSTETLGAAFHWNGLDIPFRVRNKFYEYAAKGRFNAVEGKDITHYLWRSTERALPRAYRHGVCGFLGLPDPRGLTVREAKAGDYFTFNFIIYRNRVVEIGSHDSIRKMAQGWLKRWVADKPAGNQPSMTLREIYKQKKKLRVGGGLMDNRTTPRDRFAKTKAARA